MSKPSPPKPPDPKDTSAASTGTNVSTAIANNLMGMVNQNTPLGSISYDQTGAYTWKDPYTGEKYTVPTFDATTTYTGRGQKIHDANTSAQLKLAQTARGRSKFLRDYLPEGVDYSGLSEFSGLQGQLAGGLSDAFGEDFTGSRDDHEAALMARMQPQLDRDREALETRLANQGIGYGTDAWSSAMDDYGRNVNDARLAAITQAGAEQRAFADMAMRAGAASDAQRAQQLQETFARRNQPINEVTALLSGSQLQAPNFNVFQPQGAPITDNARIINDIYQGELNAYGTQMSGYNSLMGGLFKLAGSIISDVRLKTDLELVGEQNGFGLYAFRYLWDEPGTERIGHIAQEVLQSRPDAVENMNGIYAVNYAALEGGEQ